MTEPKYKPLPEICFAKHPSEGTLIVIKDGETGYYPADLDKWPALPNETIDNQVWRLNQKLGVSTAERMAMEIGSMMGWNIPGAIPERHLARALAEDLTGVDPALGAEARAMISGGKSYDEIKERFKRVFDIAAAARETA
jgi:hypothetical protein